jgi:integrase
VNALEPHAGGAIVGDQPAAWQAAAAAWLESKFNRGHSPHTRRSYERVLAGWFEFLAQLGRDPGQVGGVEVQAYQKRLNDLGRAPATVAQRLAVISSFYRFAQHKFTLQDRGREVTLIQFNPVDRAERPRLDPFAGSQKVYPDELTLLLAQPDRQTLQGRRDYSILLTFVFTGRRLAELARLTWGDLYFSGQQVFYAYTGKGGKSGRRQLPPPAWAAIRDYLTYAGRIARMGPNSPLWLAHSDAGQYLPNVSPNQGEQPLSVAMIRRLVNRYTRQALGRSVSPHALRHAAAILRERAGDDPRAIQKFLDHSSLEMTDRYMSAMRIEADGSWQQVADLLKV